MHTCFSLMHRLRTVFNAVYAQRFSARKPLSSFPSDEQIADFIEDDEYQKIKKNLTGLQSDYHHFTRKAFVIQPRVKWGPQRDDRINYSLLLRETIALVETLPNWKVNASLTMSTTSLNRKGIFGKGNLEKLYECINQQEVNALVFSVDILSSAQQTFLEQRFSLPVFDRYSIVLQIFNDHAKTKEAKLQIALAEIPYIRSKLRDFHMHGAQKESQFMQAIGGSKQRLLEERKKILRNRESKLKKMLENVSRNRDFLKVARIKKEIPSVAVVGYTNAGKTSLIKALTRDESLQPKDQLFATLDVTTHSGRLPCGQQTLFIDTVGFVSHIPIALIHAFHATLKDALTSDLVVHVYDVSHPDVDNQRETVHHTLKSFELSDKLMGSIIEVANKIDCVPESDLKTSENEMPVSAAKGINIEPLKERIEQRLLANTNRTLREVRVPMGGEQSQWLWKEATVVGVRADPNDENFALMEVLFTNASFARFKSRFRYDE
ncbi:putative GTP-binding protein 6-like protein [Dinothrombium tinctorium]|uniref:Putative GTP-binding protein 6-like protein n=1 Tax=Dinothrombium tinctorium TaxID=1965070 RepID=A0A3S3PPC5_9ACAR|nr:putative GTP-binding protein 6-like protein [Dinothrombium tinctorium]RWS16604.1 putative GTP-binding protein 6-like protein [Dinothrombium tinctorium]